MKPLLHLIVLTLVTWCALSQSELLHVTQQIKLSEFIDEPAHGGNHSLVAPRQQLVFVRMSMRSKKDLLGYGPPAERLRQIASGDSDDTSQLSHAGSHTVAEQSVFNRDWNPSGPWK